MNELIAALILAVVQGITEWLPISSSGHLVLIEGMLGFEGGLLFDVAVHFGTLMAVFVYFGQEIMDILRDLLSLNFKSENGRIGVALFLSSIPVGIIGFLLLDFFEDVFRNLEVVVIGFAITSLFLFIASLDFDSKNRRKRKKEVPSWVDALTIGFAQILALVPGISRSGTSISAGLLRGLDSRSAAKFGFLMAIPVIFGANILVIGNNTLPSEMIWATLVAFFVGLLAIHFMMKFVMNSRKNLRWFAWYALLLSLGIGIYLLT